MEVKFTVYDTEGRAKTASLERVADEKGARMVVFTIEHGGGFEDQFFVVGDDVPVFGAAAEHVTTAGPDATG